MRAIWNDTYRLTKSRACASPRPGKAYFGNEVQISMTNVLVVDESVDSRLLVGGLLTKHEDWQISYADNGNEALEHLERQSADLVLTDLQMPEMGGLELISNVKQRFPGLPVVLMTSEGSEEVAVQALHEGAASYVPKQSMARNLDEALARVLDVADRTRSQNRLLNCMEQSESKFVLDNDPSQLPTLLNRFQASLRMFEVCDESDWLRVGVALDEALVNAMYHGNLELDSKLREDDDRIYYGLAKERRDKPPYRDRRIHVTEYMLRGEATFVIRDEGQGFDVSSIPNPEDPENLSKPSGRGILLMRAFLDEVRYNDIGNEVTVVKRRKQEDVEENGD